MSSYEWLKTREELPKGFGTVLHAHADGSLICFAPDPENNRTYVLWWASGQKIERMRQERLKDEEESQSQPLSEQPEG